MVLSLSYLYKHTFIEIAIHQKLFVIPHLMPTTFIIIIVNVYKNYI